MPTISHHVLFEFQNRTVTDGVLGCWGSPPAALELHSRVGHADDEERAGQQGQKEARAKKRGGGRKNSMKREEDRARTRERVKMHGGRCDSLKQKSNHLKQRFNEAAWGE